MCIVGKLPKSAEINRIFRIKRIRRFYPLYPEYPVHPVILLTEKGTTQGVTALGCFLLSGAVIAAPDK
jgi:hypothetical protein